MAEGTQDIPQDSRQSPNYDVFRATGGGANGAWEPVATDVKASSRKAAIVAAVADLPEDAQYGTFAVARAGEFQQLTRRRKVEPTDIWE